MNPTPDDYLTHLHDERWQIVRCTTGKGIEISDHDFVVLPKAIKIVDVDNEVLFKDYVRFHCDDFAVCSEIENGSLDYVFVTERERKYANVEGIRNWLSKLKPDGFLVLHIGCEFEVLQQNGKLWKLPDYIDKKSVGVIRYGAFGDMMQVSSVLAGLKKQGYYTVLYCSPPGSDVLTHDPNIDEIVLQDKDQVRNNELQLYWDFIKTRHDKFINLSESVERTWLASKGDIQFDWSYEVRHKYLNTNYLQFQHELAGVPHKPNVKFYATDEEREWAKTERAKMGKKVIMWCLSGSSVHKVFPYMDWFVATMMIGFPDVDIVLTGGLREVELQGGWQEEPRVHSKCGEWSIRQTMVFAQTQTDLIIGPETGVLNAMCCEPMPKIVFLSHSSNENLTRDWNNTKAFSAPRNALEQCGHCCLHRIHYNWDAIKRDEESGAAWCQARMDREAIFMEAIRKLHLLSRTQLKAVGFK